MQLNKAIRELIGGGMSLDDVALELIGSLSVVIENKKQSITRLQETKSLIDNLVDKITLASDELELNVVFERDFDSLLDQGSYCEACSEGVDVSASKKPACVCVGEEFFEIDENKVKPVISKIEKKSKPALPIIISSLPESKTMH
jgi:hypothetical protein|tara:strand:+ start:3881 stop:4315 length:435 start_codon:yes stop_codon:yes gene_type:complete